jgi:hypothetical protein
VQVDRRSDESSEGEWHDHAKPERHR